MESPADKHWAKAYLLDPLTAPEPSQETGPGSSFFNPQRSLSVRTRGKDRDFRSQKISAPRNYPTPPGSVSPTTSEFHPSNPFASSPRASPQNAEWASADKVLNRSNSIRSHNSDTRPYSPPYRTSRPQSPISSNPFRDDQSNYSYELPEGQPAVRLGRSNTARVPRPRYSGHGPPPTHGNGNLNQNQNWWNRDQVPRRSLTNAQSQSNTGGLRRATSLTARYPGDLSHRPLNMILHEQRTADRPINMHGSKKNPVDLIDSLDATAPGGTYHHGGPYDATLASRNVDKRFAPIEAVKETNMEAIKATPEAYIKDSLVKHVPLQGTAVVPPGATDMTGEVMDYKEGTDLMREPNAPGGAYRRFEGINYHPDDLKGKGEPGYSQDLRLKKQKEVEQTHRGSGIDGSDIEMVSQSQTNNKNGNVSVRQRSASNGAGPSNSATATTSGAHTNLGRRNTTGRRFADGLKRRFSNFRRKKASSEE